MSVWHRSPHDHLRWFPVSAIRPNPQQPRRSFDESALRELAQNIREVGLLQPLTVTLDSGHPVLVAGERRLRAAAMAGLTRVPCLITDASPDQSALLALVENLQREDLTCFEEAEGIARLMALGGFNQAEVAQKLGYAPSTVANKLRLLSLSSGQQEQLRAAGMTERHARALLRLEEPQREVLLKKMIAAGWTVSETERAVDRLCQPKSRRRITPVIRDVRLFFNTVDHAVSTMKKSGVAAYTQQRETDDAYEYLIRIPKPGSAKRA